MHLHRGAGDRDVVEPPKLRFGVRVRVLAIGREVDHPVPIAPVGALIPTLDGHARRPHGEPSPNEHEGELQTLAGVHRHDLDLGLTRLDAQEVLVLAHLGGAPPVRDGR